MTSTIGIPIKLLNEAAVCVSMRAMELALTSSRATLSRSRSLLVKSTAASSSKVRLNSILAVEELGLTANS